MRFFKKDNTGNELCFLRIEVPRNNEQGPLTMEQVLLVLHGRGCALSFENWGEDGTLRQAIVLQRSQKEFVINVLEKHYPGILVIEDKNPLPQTRELSMQELTLASVAIFPIRRYSQTADWIRKVWTDTSIGILSSLTRGSRFIQIIFEPENPSWRKKGKHTLSIYEAFSSIWIFRRFWKWRDAFFRAVYCNFWLRVFCLILIRGQAQRMPEKIDHRGHGKESVGEAISSKLSQIGFRVTIRLICSAQDSKEAIQEIASGFAQFGIPELNEFRLKGKHPIYGSKLAQARKQGKGMILSLEELAGILVLPTKQTNISELSRASFRVLPYHDCYKKRGITIGTSIGSQKEIKISYQELSRHLAIFGKTGVGKSTLLLSILHGLMEKGQGVGLLDPHGDLLQNILEIIPQHRQNDVVLMDLADAEYPISINLLSQEAGRKDRITASIVDSFRTIFTDSWGPRTDYILNQAVYTLLEQPKASLLGVPRLLIDAKYRKECVQYIHDPVIRSFWAMEYSSMPARLRVEAITPILNKVNRFLMVPMIRNMLGQKENKVHFRQIMDERKILLIHLPKGILGEENSILLGNLLLAHLQLAALSRAEEKTSNRVPFYMVVDELQHFLSRSIGSIETILAEGRKYRMHLILACQHVSQLGGLTETIFGNVNTMASFALGYQDAQKLAGYFRDVESDDLLNLPAYHAYLKTERDGRHSVFSFRTAKPGINHDISSQIQENSRAKYARPRREVEEEIEKFFRSELALP
ncbi:MAG: DUF87 domain-containing protein [Candidatus Brocadiae bacterium]|nr:DUF87 domain-containing protein [Candidatus Brocadiia bacterium]